MAIILVGGGSRCGKSRYALELAHSFGERLAFVATAQAFDEEMRERIARHRAERDTRFTTFEEPIALAATLRNAQGFDAIVVDCLTLWATNLLLSDQPIPTEALLTAAKENPAKVIFVTNEVGCGIVPENKLARQFRDLAGRLNQDVAAAAEAVYWTAFGIPMKIK